MTPRPEFKLCILGALLAVSATAHPQGLEGLAAARIVVEDLDQDAKDCGVTQNGLDAAARIVLSNSKFRVSQDVAPFIYLSASVMKSGSVCFGSVILTVRRAVLLSRQGSWVPAAVYTDGLTHRAGQADFGRRTTLEVEELTKKMLGQWLKDNLQ